MDFREESDFNECFIRDSFNFIMSKKNSWLGLVEYLKNCSKKATDNEQKYGSKPIRRILVVPSKHSQEDYNSMFKQVIEICDTNNIDLDKVYILTETIATFQLKFGFLCIDDQIKNGIKKQSGGTMGDKEEFSDEVRSLLYSYSRFPFILLETQLLLGSTYNLANKKQMNDLGVKSIVRFDMFKIVKDEHCEEYTTMEKGPIEGLEGLTIKINAQNYIDFNGIVSAIRELPSPRMLCCAQNMGISANFAIAYLMEVLNQGSNKGSLIVFSKIGTTEVDKMIYAQLMMHQTSTTFKKI